MGKTRSPVYSGHGARPKVTDDADLGGFGYCKKHGKVFFPSRTRAKKFAKRKYPGDVMNAYKCGRWYHIGHLLPAAKRGIATRDGHKWIDDANALD